ncbi:putative lipoprotein NlpE involved in copper resistance [Anoxybacillus calidus]|jgi:uncharacterized lipoprotein NlpE involved in copper resistance|uniref:Putative lipoprotein NlpE involved in copper resistance n=1 Tax=[Anoxybacillus] calidus TaxID=575178 RepID=A0A7W0BWS8_9BACL|nr:hypothetical protein [Anoxybacillus calidus]MBA2871344.1 putative lipoprotein NlpE involved in copper resistance [Anoxybacillus calidus]
MKKPFLFVILLVLILVGCNNKHIFLSGEGENWKGEYSANINGNREDGNYIFGYKNGEKDTKRRRMKKGIEQSILMIHSAMSKPKQTQEEIRPLMITMNTEI